MPMPSLSRLRTLPAGSPGACGRGMTPRGARARRRGRAPRPARACSGAHRGRRRASSCARSARPPTSVRVLPQRGEPVELELRAPGGRVRGRPAAAAHAAPLSPRGRLPGRGAPIVVRDAYSFAPTLGELDLHLIGEGRHERLWDALGAHPRTLDGATGTAFAVWAPGARAVSVVGDFNAWNERAHPMRIAGRGRRLGAVRARGRRRATPTSSRSAARDGVGPPQGRPVRAARRVAAAHRLGRLRAASPLARRGLAGARGATAEPHAGADVDLRGAPRLLAPQHARGQPLADLRRAGRRAGRLRARASASRTSS